MRGLREIIIYLLLIIGAVVMLLPFAWMISTSFKLPSEVTKWPPQWGSKNFLSKREIKVKSGFDVGSAGSVAGSLREALASVAAERKKNVFTISVDDDLFYRGELHILIEGGGRYSESLPMYEKLEGILSELREISSDMKKMGFKAVKLEEYDYAEDFFEDYFTQSINEFGRLSFAPKLSSLLEKNALLIENNGRGLVLGLRRIKNEEDKKKLEDYYMDLKGKLLEASGKLKRFSKGVSETLSDEELKEIASILRDVLRSSPPSSTDPIAKRMIKVLQMKILDPIETIVRRIEIHDEIWNEYERVQKREIDGDEIVARFLPEEERERLLNERIRESEKLRNYLEILKDLEKEGYEGLTERFSRKLDEMLAERLMDLGIPKEKAYKRVTDLRDAVSSIISVLNERKIDLKDLVEDDDGIDEIKEKLLSAVPDSLLLKTQLSKLERLIPNGVKAGKFLKELVSESDAVSALREIYANSMSELGILKAPSIVKAVRVKYDKEKYWEVIELVLKENVPGVYLRDERYRVAVFFNFKEILANVFQNYVDAWHAAPFARYYVNTVFVATTTTILEVIVASMAAFAFSILNFKGRDFLFGIFLATMMVPGEVLLVPNYITISKFGWIDTYYALIIPWIVSVFAIFLIRQHFLTLPRELYDAAKIDGCSSWRYLWTIAVPLSKPVIITGALLKFVGSWNAFLWVLIVTNDPKYRTLPVGLYTFRGEAGDIYNQLMAAATFSILPVIILFLFAQKYFIRGIARTGLK